MRVRMKRPWWLLGTAVFSTLVWHGSTPAQENAAVGQACLARANVDRWLVIDANRILFATRDQRLYRNDLARSCPALRPSSQLSYTNNDGQICAGATFQILIRVSTSANRTPVFDRATGTTTAVEGPGLIGGPVCALGEFTPVSAGEAAALIAESQQQPPSRRERRAAREAEDAAASDEANEQ